MGYNPTASDITDFCGANGNGTWSLMFLETILTYPGASYGGYDCAQCFFEKAGTPDWGMSGHFVRNCPPKQSTILFEPNPDMYTNYVAGWMSSHGISAPSRYDWCEAGEEQFGGPTWWNAGVMSYISDQNFGTTNTSDYDVNDWLIPYVMNDIGVACADMQNWVHEGLIPPCLSLRRLMKALAAVAAAMVFIYKYGEEVLGPVLGAAIAAGVVDAMEIWVPVLLICLIILAGIYFLHCAWQEQG